jgi:hypothetical protein
MKLNRASVQRSLLPKTATSIHWAANRIPHTATVPSHFSFKTVQIGCFDVRTYKLDDDFGQRRTLRNPEQLSGSNTMVGVVVWKMATKNNAFVIRKRLARRAPSLSNRSSILRRCHSPTEPLDRKLSNTIQSPMLETTIRATRSLSNAAKLISRRRKASQWSLPFLSFLLFLWNSGVITEHF